MWDPPFPKVREWANKSLPQEERSRLDERLYAIQYHLIHADSAAGATLIRITDHDWSALPDWSVARFIWGPEQFGWQILQNGDIAVREAASALDCGLQLVNYSLGVGLDPEEVNWRPATRGGSALRARLQRRENTQALVDEIDRVFHSIGYYLLSEYRNWVTHRGAPLLVATPPADVELPGNLVELEDPAGAGDLSLRWHVGRHLEIVLGEKTRVASRKFDRPVRHILNLDIVDAEEDVELPGRILIGKGSTVSFRQSGVSYGTMLDRAEDYLESNPLALHPETMEYGGYTLAVYSGSAYTAAVNDVLLFANDILSGYKCDWDKRLAELLGIATP